jgi:polyketide cyclase/dehydrase/lipid transport protein
MLASRADGGAEGVTMRITKSTTVAAAPEKVFAYVADFKRHPEWSSHGLEVTVPDGALAIGTSIQTSAHQFGKQNDVITVTELEPGTRVGFETKGKAGVVRHWFAVGPASGGAMLEKGVEFVKPSVASRLAMPGIRLNVPRMLGKDLERIKARIEGGGN